MADEGEIHQQGPAGAVGDRKVRISQPPYVSLREAVRIAEQIYEQGGGSADKNMLTVILNNSISSSSFTRKLQALRLYRLISGAVAPVSLTDVGLSIVAPKEESARAIALKTAATGPEVFRKSYDRLKGKLLPQDEFLRNYFMHDLALPNKVVADAWIDSFKVALETAGLLFSRPDGKTQVLEGPTNVPTEAPALPDATAPNVVQPTPPEHLSIPERVPENNDGHTSRITLADGRIATVFIPDRLTQRDATRLKGALAGISAIIESMVEDLG